jgi:hypothetical protein
VGRRLLGGRCPRGSVVGRPVDRGCLLGRHVP